MPLFKGPKDASSGAAGSPGGPDDSLPFTVFDFSKQYDLYCTTPSEDRLYEDVRIVGIRSFEKRRREFSTTLIGGYLEIEARDGTRMMIPHMRIYMICEHGAQPKYTVLKDRGADGGFY